MVFVDGSVLRLCDACEIGCEEVCTLKGHDGDIYSCSWSDQWILSAGKDKVIIAWNPDGEPVHRLVGHAWSIFSVVTAIQADRPVIVSAAGLW